MVEETEQLQAVLVTASEAGDQLRRALVQHGIALVSATASLAQLRKALVRGDVRPLALCVTMDEPTMRRHGRALTRILDDRAAFAVQVRAIGVHAQTQPARDWAGLGCDAHAHDVQDVRRLLEQFSAARRSQPSQREMAAVIANAQRQERSANEGSVNEVR